MLRSSVFAATVLSLFVVTACDNASSDDKKVKSAQAEANDRSGAAIGEAAEKVKSAQAEADEKIAAAQADFTRLREDYRHTTTTKLADLDQKVADLAAKARQTSGRVRTDRDATLREIHLSRQAFDRNYQALESTSASTWDDAKVGLDKEWTDLKALVDKA